MYGASRVHKKAAVGQATTWRDGGGCSVIWAVVVARARRAAGRFLAIHVEWTHFN